MLVLHGLTGTPWEVRPLCEALHHRHGFTVWAPLLAGHGGTPRQLGEIGWRDWQASALAALDRLTARCDRVAVAGLSMGGLLTLRLAHQRADQIAALLLMAVPLWLPALQARVVRALFRLGVRAIPKLGGSDVREPAARGQNPGYREFPLRAVVEMLDLQALVRAELAEVRTPALIVHGRRDHTAPPACAPALVAALAHAPARLHWLEHSYHLLPVDADREELFEVAGRFLGERLA